MDLVAVLYPFRYSVILHVLVRDGEAFNWRARNEGDLTRACWLFMRRVESAAWKRVLMKLAADVIR